MVKHSSYINEQKKAEEDVKVRSSHVGRRGGLVAVFIIVCVYHDYMLLSVYVYRLKDIKYYLQHVQVVLAMYIKSNRYLIQVHL